MDTFEPQSVFHFNSVSKKFYSLKGANQFSGMIEDIPNQLTKFENWLLYGQQISPVNK